MSLELIIRPEAEVDRVLESIRANPKIHGLVYREYRRALTRRFPYGVFYAVRPERIVVFAILHSARDPRLWTERSRNAR